MLDSDREIAGESTGTRSHGQDWHFTILMPPAPASGPAPVPEDLELTLPLPKKSSQPRR